MERQWYYDTYVCSFEGVLCISLQKSLDMDKSLTIHFAYGYICNCNVCSRASGLLHRNKHYLIISYIQNVNKRNEFRSIEANARMNAIDSDIVWVSLIKILSHDVHRHIFTFSKQTFHEALDFCNVHSLMKDIILLTAA